MLRPLVYLCAVSLLAGAAALTFNESSDFDISSCPISFFGQPYERLYVNFTSVNFAVCFDGFYRPETRGDCILGPAVIRDYGMLNIYPSNPVTESIFRQHLPSIGTDLQCVLNVITEQNGGPGYLALANFGTQAALYVQSPSTTPVDFLVQVGGNTAETVTVGNGPNSPQTGAYFDLSACRKSGVVYRPGTVVRSDSDTCSTETCDRTAVLHTFGCDL
ncbi:uncharacterized protein LOC113140826 [Mastacembelus armatus]|uniref:uncharacterized protein LOC113140826 n=1 Tax=Mastacembelus armatus TaxID=205130 RepID=UPI000E46347E|nr:uncharacterized protein LOC113140826 [Mastacembelus armatus]